MVKSILNFLKKLFCSHDIWKNISPYGWFNEDGYYAGRVWNAKCSKCGKNIKKRIYDINYMKNYKQL